MEVTLYSTHCPKCQILEKKLNQKGINYKLVDDNKEVVSFGKANKIMSAPILKVNEDVLDFSKANNWLNEVDDSVCEEACKF